MVDVCNIQVMKPLLEQYGFRFSKAKGQNFRIAPRVQEYIAREAGVDDTAGVLEIGPGIGSLTQQLCLRAEKVCAVELDSRLKPILGQTVGEFHNLELLWGDVLKLDIPALVRERFRGLRPMACANLPYYITSPILTALLEADCFESVTVMVQKEVAQRIAAAPGTADYSAFTIFCQYYAQPRCAPAGTGMCRMRRCSSELCAPALPCGVRSSATVLPPVSRNWASRARQTSLQPAICPKMSGVRR